MQFLKLAATFPYGLVWLALRPLTGPLRGPVILTKVPHALVKPFGLQGRNVALR